MIALPLVLRIFYAFERKKSEMVERFHKKHSSQTEKVGVLATFHKNAFMKWHKPKCWLSERFFFFVPLRGHRKNSQKYQNHLGRGTEDF